MRREILELLAELGRERVLLVVTNEPDLFDAWVQPQQRYLLQRGQLMPAQPPVAA